MYMYIYIYIYMYRTPHANDMATSEKSDPNTLNQWFFVEGRGVGVLFFAWFWRIRSNSKTLETSLFFLGGGCCLLFVVCCLLFVTRPEDAGKPFSQLLRNPWGLLLAIKDWTQPRSAFGQINGKRHGDHFQLEDRAEPLSQGQGWKRKNIMGLVPVFKGEKHGCFQKLGYPQNGWFIMETPIKMDDLEVPPF